MVTTTSDRRERRGDSHKSDQIILSFVGSDLPYHLNHVYDKKAEAMEGLLVLLDNRVDSVVSSPDMAMIFIYLWGDAGEWGWGQISSKWRRYWHSP